MFRMAGFAIAMLAMEKPLFVNKCEAIIIGSFPVGKKLISVAGFMFPLIHLPEIHE